MVALVVAAKAPSETWGQLWLLTFYMDPLLFLLAPGADDQGSFVLTVLVLGGLQWLTLGALTGATVAAVCALSRKAR